MKLVIASGKGGVGKSMLCSVLAALFAKDRKIVAVDCDADAPNLHIWLGKSKGWDKKEKISISEKPVINSSQLTIKEVKQCVEKCRFSALREEKGKLKLNPFLCEGCGACEVFCPSQTIKMRPVKSGEIRIKKIYSRGKYIFPLISGQLFPGETGSGKVVAEIKKEAEKIAYDLMLIDSAPGTGCPVIASLQGADFVILITEPTLCGLSDLKRVLKVVKHFNIPWGLVINKWDINKKLSHKMEKWAGKKFIGKISYDKEIFKKISQLIPIFETNLRANKEIKQIFNNFSKSNL